MSEEARPGDGAQLRAALDLLHHALAPNDDRAHKCRRLMDGLAAVIGADLWLWVRSRVDPDGLRTGQAPVNLDHLISDSFTPERVAAWAERSLEVHGPPPEHKLMYALLQKGRHFTVTRPQLVSDERWNTGFNALWAQRMGHSELLFTWLPLLEGPRGTVLSGGIFLRALGKPPFTPDHARFVHLAWAACPSLHHDGLPITDAAATQGTPDMTALSPRLQSILAQLLQGRSAPQIADDCHLSVHTVREYIATIYRHFGVNSRAQLHTRFRHVAPAAASPLTDAQAAQPTQETVNTPPG